jgi:hypothetical protein
VSEAPPKWTVSIFAATIILLVVAVNVLILWWWIIPPKIVVEADAGFKKATQTIDPEKLRAWALEEIAKHKPSTNDFAGKDIPDSEIPSYIQALYPYPAEDATVRFDENQPYVMIVWGGGFFHWKIDIGSTNLIGTTGSGNHFTTVEWAPGIYYSREDTRHPFK